MLGADLKNLPQNERDSEAEDDEHVTLIREATKWVCGLLYQESQDRAAKERMKQGKGRPRNKTKMSPLGVPAPVPTEAVDEIVPKVPALQEVLATGILRLQPRAKHGRGSGKHAAVTKRSLLHSMPSHVLVELVTWLERTLVNNQTGYWVCVDMEDDTDIACIEVPDTDTPLLPCFTNEYRAKRFIKENMPGVVVGTDIRLKRARIAEVLDTMDVADMAAAAMERGGTKLMAQAPPPLIVGIDVETDSQIVLPTTSVRCVVACSYTLRCDWGFLGACSHTACSLRPPPARPLLPCPLLPCPGLVSAGHGERDAYGSHFLCCRPPHAQQHQRGLCMAAPCRAAAAQVFAPAGAASHRDPLRAAAGDAVHEALAGGEHATQGQWRQGRSSRCRVLFIATQQQRWRQRGCKAGHARGVYSVGQGGFWRSVLLLLLAKHLY